MRRSPEIAGYVTDIPIVAGFKPMLALAWLGFVDIICRVRPPARSGGFGWCDRGQGATAAILAATRSAAVQRRPGSGMARLPRAARGTRRGHIAPMRRR